MKHMKRFRGRPSRGLHAQRAIQALPYPGCVVWGPYHLLELGMPVNLPPVRAVRPPTSGVWSNKQVADESRRGIGTPAGTRTPVVYMLDLTDVQPTVEVLEGYLLPLAQDIKLGKYGQSSSLVVSTRNPSIRHFVELLAVQHSLPIFLAESTSPL